MGRRTVTIDERTISHRGTEGTKSHKERLPDRKGLWSRESPIYMCKAVFQAKRVRFTFLTEARTMSPLQPAGSLFSLPLIPYAAMTYL